MKSINVTILFVCILIIGCATPKTSNEFHQTATSLDNRGFGIEIFSIGYEDGVEWEFRPDTFYEEATDYNCTIGDASLTEQFTRYHCTSGNNAYPHSSVESITINLNLKNTYNTVILRLARVGDETTIIMIDAEKTFTVTALELGSNAREQLWGACNVKLGTLEKGMHTLQLTVSDDGKGNGRYPWDAITLFVK